LIPAAGITDAGCNTKPHKLEATALKRSAIEHSPTRWEQHVPPFQSGDRR